MTNIFPDINSSQINVFTYLTVRFIISLFQPKPQANLKQVLLRLLIPASPETVYVSLLQYHIRAHLHWTAQFLDFQR